MLIEQETFDSVKELAAIQTEISACSANLRTLKEETNNYLLLREKMAEERIAEVLRESQDVLEKISQNHSELTAFGRELKAYATELHDFFLAVSALSQDFTSRTKDLNEALDKKRDEIKGILDQIQKERSAIGEERKQLARERKQTTEETRLLNDRRETLARGFAELERLKIKTV